MKPFENVSAGEREQLEISFFLSFFFFVSVKPEIPWLLKTDLFSGNCYLTFLYTELWDFFFRRERTPFRNFSYSETSMLDS
jgi:hypothetical protein